MQTVKIQTTQNIAIDYPVAGLGERILGRLIDLGIFLVLWIVLIIGSSNLNSSNSSKNFTIVLWVFGFIFCFYDLVCEFLFNGQSIGKRLMKIKVVSLDGSRPTVGQYLLRWAFRMVDFSISFQLAGLISVAATSRKQRIGDVVAGTAVIKTQPKVQLENLAFHPGNLDYQPVYPQVVQLTDKEIVLIHEVLEAYNASGNSNLLYYMKTRIQEHLGIQISGYMDDMVFLETILKDYNHLSVRADTN